jgi:hypothetical protein
MNSRARVGLAEIVLIAVLIGLGLAVALLMPRAQQTGTSVPMTIQPALTAVVEGPTTIVKETTAVLPISIPKPSDIANPTPWPDATLQPMTPVPTRSGPREEPPTPAAPVERATPDPSEPFILTGYAHREPDTAVSANESSLIVVGTVKDILPARWTTIDGKRPPNPHAPENKETIFTPILIEVRQYAKGSQVQRELLLSAFGGTVGQDSVNWASDNMYRFTLGEQVVVFLRERNQLLSGIPLWDVMEHYTITSDQQIANDYRTLSLPELLGEVQKAEAR